MDVFSGVALALVVGAFATVVGFDRDRAFYPAMMIVIAGYYVLFAVIGGDPGALIVELLIMGLFVAVTVAGFRWNLWLVVAALFGHGLLDVVHAGLVDNPGVPEFWPMFCMAFDVVAAGYLAVRLLHRSRPPALASLRPWRFGRRHRGVATAVLLLAGTAVTAPPSEAAPGDQRIARIEGRAVAYRVLGQGAPTIVLISGLGDGMASFDGVATELARTATVIAYDRAGYGGSDPAAGPRDAQEVDRELFALLKASGVNSPYVLVGHSVGGLYAEYSAARHPGEVVGLILEESRPADFTDRCQAAGLSRCVVTPAMARFLPKGARAEVAALEATIAQVAAQPRRSDLPVLVLSRPSRGAAGSFAALWTAAQADLAAGYAGSRHLTAPAGGHSVHQDQRDWFIASVRAFVATLD